MSDVQEILVISSDPQLRSELESAAAMLGDAQPRLRFVADQAGMWESLRARPPGMVVAEFGADPAEIPRLARELSSMTPPTPLVAAFRPHGFGEEISESSVLIEAMRAGVRDFLRRPISTTELRLQLDYLGTRGQSGASPGWAQGRVVSFVSNKGGVGKSTLAVNSAVGLARRFPGRVLLIDASLQMGVAANLLDLQPQSSLTDLALERDRLDVTLIRQTATQHASGLHVLPAPADAVEALEVDDTLLARVITLARRAYDFVIIDTFPMFDRVVVATLDLSDRSYVVVENVVPTLLGAVKLLGVLQRIGFPEERQRIVINRLQRVEGSLTLEDISARLGRPIDHVLPFDKRVIAAANTGEPVGLRWLRLGSFSRGLDRLVADIASLASTSSESPSTNGRLTYLDPPAKDDAAQLPLEATQPAKGGRLGGATP